MAKKIKPETQEMQKEGSADLELQQTQQEMQNLRDYINLQDKAFFRRQLLLALNRIAEAVEDLELSEEENEE